MLGTLADVQAIRCDSTAHVQRFFLPNVRSRMTVMSPNDVMIICFLL